MTDIPTIPVTLLKGDDEVVLRDAVRLLVDDLVGDEDRALVVEEVEVGPRPTTATCCSASSTPRRPRRCSPTSGSCWAGSEKRERGELVQPLVDYLQDPLPSSRSPRVAAARCPKALTEAIAQVGGTVVDTSPGRKVGEWVAEHLAEAGLKVDNEVARLVTWVGDEPSRLLGLIDLLRSTYGAGVKISAAEIEPFLGDDGGVPPWDLTDAIDRGDRAAALELLQRMIGQGDRHPFQVLRHAALPLRPDAPARRGGGERGEGGGRAARPQGLDVPGQEGARPDPPARPRARWSAPSTCWPRPTSTCAGARPGPTTSCSRCWWPGWPRCRDDDGRHLEPQPRVPVGAPRGGPARVPPALDVGCGQGSCSRAWRPAAEVVGIDRHAAQPAEAAVRTRGSQRSSSSRATP